MESCPPGYPRLAAFLSSEHNFSIYRGFDFLHSRVLLNLQDQIVTLERELDEKDRQDEQNGLGNRLFSRSRDEDEDKTSRSRPKILDDIRLKLAEYGMTNSFLLGNIEFSNHFVDEILVKARDLVSFQRPCGRDYGSVRDWMWIKQPLVKKEQAFIRHKEDVLTLHSGREWCGFDGYVESLLLKLDCRFVRVISQDCRFYYQG